MMRTTWLLAFTVGAASFATSAAGARCGAARASALSAVRLRALPRRAAVCLAAKPKKPAKAGGFGAKPATPTGPTAKELLAQATKVYEALDAMTSTDDAQTPVTQWSITVRADGVPELSDWVPIALLALHCAGVSEPSALVPGALAAARREVLEAGGQVVPKLRTAPRQNLEFAYEPLHSFSKHVCDGLSTIGTAREDARRTLGVEAGASAADLKRAHRKLVMELHPDRFVGDEAGAAAAIDRMRAVSEAYEQLGGGRGGRAGGGAGGDRPAGSWYEGIGGKARAEFTAVGKLGKDEAQPWLDVAGACGHRLGVCALAADVPLDFVARNVMRTAAASANAAAAAAADGADDGVEGARAQEAASVA
ncbi:hypothetical protein KFE25_004483 [Diacronema lutheri]|uniref:J domain-containing protein n=2 Tax=Diacronema lutheri TaxID=2081491 RepID=A0A8J6C7Z9_DIALT|nr:hypothetical protein KFE25_004483 [Diacronema lutheri]